MRAALYARVSTADQSCELQLHELREYLARRKWEVAGEYVDTGWSGSKTNRPELNRLMQDARVRRFDAVVVWKLDRFGRSLVHCVSAIQELSSVGVRFLAVSQGLDTDQANPTSQLLLHILAAVSQFERELIRERVAAGMRNAREKGKAIGRPRKVFDRQEVLRLRQEGLSIAQIGRRMDLGDGTVARVLQAAERASRACQKAPG
ncbi:MAG TPA: recombinase family protein [Edaphobacter sp.]|nr:recombinase family protein [Edaphobacter sp.]